LCTELQYKFRPRPPSNVRDQFSTSERSVNLGSRRYRQMVLESNSLSSQARGLSVRWLAFGWASLLLTLISLVWSDPISSQAPLKRNVLILSDVGMSHSLTAEVMQQIVAGVPETPERHIEFFSVLWERTKWIWITSLLIIAVLSAVVVYVQYGRKQLKLVKASQMQLSGLLINAEEKERSRVASEFHDDFSQRLSILALGLKNVDVRTIYRYQFGRPERGRNDGKRFNGQVPAEVPDRR
jgi:signal transduction histidine kinase